ncbi:MAG: class I SAM-dependent methyltransferase [Elusimicrobiales bacterium]|nr:class I SAM-dependent methyltransferase [Elusimicrobiales bacterium]
MKGTRANEKLYWDSRAANYPRPFGRSNAGKTRRMLRLLAGLGVDFAGRRLLDIGCGTGVYALPLAKTAASVLGVDSSAAMLAVYRTERRARGIKNAPCLRAEWAGLPAARVKGRFDIAFASMTAAVKTRADILKMEAAAPLCVYIGWAGLRRNALLEKVYAAHGLEYRAPEGEERTLRLLKALGRRPRVVRVRDNWTKTASVGDTLRELAVSMAVNGARLDEGLARRLIRPFTHGGRVRQRTLARKAVLVWRPPFRRAGRQAP